jgi:hypothetical protein
MILKKLINMIKSLMVSVVRMLIKFDTKINHIHKFVNSKNDFIVIFFEKIYIY